MNNSPRLRHIPQWPCLLLWWTTNFANDGHGRTKNKWASLYGQANENRRWSALQGKSNEWMRVLITLYLLPSPSTMAALSITWPGCCFPRTIMIYPRVNTRNDLLLLIRWDDNERGRRKNDDDVHQRRGDEICKNFPPKYCHSAKDIGQSCRNECNYFITYSHNAFGCHTNLIKHELPVPCLLAVNNGGPLS